MAMTKAQILAEALTLNPDERAELAEDLYHSVELDPLTPEQSDELQRRVDAIDRGEVELIPAEEAMRRLRERTRR